MLARGLTSPTISELSPKKLRLSCFHDGGAEGEASIRAELGEPMEMDVMAFYNEAIRRLPTADMPELVDCIVNGGHCIGLLDPVSNIIVNALNLLCRRMCSSSPSAQPRRVRTGEGSRPSAARFGGSGKGTAKEMEAAESARWITIAFRSYRGLVAFLRTYFRHLSTGQAMRYLRLAGADLAVAVLLGEHQQFSPEDPGTPDLCCGRTQFALRVAAATAGHPAPNDLARLAKWFTPSKDHLPLAAVLKKGRVLSVDDVKSIVSSLQRQHYAASPPVQVSFQRRPHPDFDQDSGRPPSNFSCVVGENYIANVAISRRHDGAVSSICDLRTPSEMKQMLFNCLDVAATAFRKSCPLHMIGDLTAAPPSASCDCEHIRYLKMCLADKIHAFYIRALSLLPHNAVHKHLRGILVAGHCYGPMDPVSNIILNAIWYDSVFPLLAMDTEVEPDILDSKSMLRMEVRSLDSLVTLLCTATGLSEHSAVEYLCYKQCDLSLVLQMASKQICSKAYDCAGQAGRHPKHFELASFLVSMSHNDIQDLRTLLTNEETKKGYPISDASLERVCKIMEDQNKLTAQSADHPRLCPTAWKMLGYRKGDFVQQQKFLRQVLEALLLDYFNRHPWEPMLKLDVICGVKKTKCGHSECYHVNFLAYNDGAASNAIASARVLFFAEVWASSFSAKRPESSTSVKIVPVPCIANGHRTESDSHAKVYCKSARKNSEKSFCCPLPYYNVNHSYLGRCAICEPTSSKIVHPPSGKHAGANWTEIGDSLDYLNLVDEPASAADCVTDSDFIYFDCLRDTKFANVLNSKPSLEVKKPIIH